ncbi:MAG TPA: Spy/CpxP family protein refolding chaperone [Burkholderiales bacterium]
MNEQDKQPDPAATPDPAAARRRARRWSFAGIAAAAAGAFAFHRMAHADGHGCGPGFGFGRPMHGAMDPESMGKFIDWRVSMMLSHVDATAEQKTRVADIAKAAARDMLPAREQHRAARAKAMALLTATTIDRAALEKLRADELALAETLSKRAVQSLADAADVLTPAQREKLAQRWKNRHA